MKAGDIIYNQTEADEWAAVKILAVDVWPDESECFHCLSYKPTATPPTLENIDALEILICHAPIGSSDFKQNWKVLGSKSISDADLVGFIEYLKHTNFPRYIEFTKQDSDELISRSNAHYREAYALGDAGKKLESIAEYSKAIDLFPLFFEAIDNRAFTYMELGDFASAIRDFEASLEVHPDGNAAFFSRGECFLKMDNLDEAEKIFLQGMHKFREHQSTYQQFLDIVKAKKRLVDIRSAKSLVQPTSLVTPKPAKVSPKKWWRFWA